MVPRRARAIGALLWIQADASNASIVAGVALALLTIYVGFRFYQQRTVADFMQDRVLSQNPSNLVGVISSKTEFFTWHAVVRQNESYSITPRHLR